MSNFIIKDEDGFERIVFGEVLIPGTVNAYGDYHTKESVRQFAYGFMISGFGVDLEHDNYDVSESIRIVESFIAQKNDPNFTEGSWVVGAYVADDQIWQAVLDGEINGYSYEALVRSLKTQMQVGEDSFIKYGVTEPDPKDGHYHKFLVILDEEGRPITGGTSFEDGHMHDIYTNSVTEEAFGHKHRYNYNIMLGG